VAGAGQLGAVGLHPYAQGVQGRGVAWVGRHQRHRLGHQLPGPLQLAAPQGQLDQVGKQRAGPLGLGDRCGQNAPGGLEPRLGGVQLSQAQLQRSPSQLQGD
jgi:hypothetical protein